MTKREKRISKGLTTKYVAEKLGIAVATLNKKERDDTFNALQTEKLCELYDCRIDEFDT